MRFAIAAIATFVAVISYTVAIVAPHARKSETPLKTALLEAGYVWGIALCVFGYTLLLGVVWVWAGR